MTMPRAAPSYLMPSWIRERRYVPKLFLGYHRRRLGTEITVPKDITEQVARTAIVSDGVAVASESGLVALKLYRQSFQDRADVVAVIKTRRVDLTGSRYRLKRCRHFIELVEAAKTDLHPP